MPMERARWHASLEDLDAAFADLERAFAERDVWIQFISAVPELAPLRDDPRYAALLGG
jgi:hypothetical protein